MSLLAMDTSSLFDPFEFPPDMDMEPPKPETNFREKLEIRTKRHHDHHVKETVVARESDYKSRDLMDIKSRPFDVQPKVHMIETPSPTAAPGVSDVQTARQKLRDSLTSALDMVVSKQLVKSVLGVGADAKDNDAVQISSPLEASKLDNLSQEFESPKDGQVVESLVVDLGPLETEAMNIDSMGGEMSVLEPPASVDDYRLSFEQADYGNEVDVAESPFKKLKTEFAEFDYVHRKLEIEEKEGRIAVEDVKGGLHIVDQARKLATDIEAELFKLYGSKKTYNQKARSLLFNLKDKSNPELRARVFSGEISPADLCRMSGEQLASKELSDWRNAKEQALDKMLVLTDADTVSGKVVKKTHKGEFVVDVQNESTVDIAPVVTRSVFPVNKVEEKAQHEQMEGQVNHSPNKSKYGSSPSLKRSRSDENDIVGGTLSYSSPIAEEKNTTETMHAELPETEQFLPTIMSLDEYMEAQDDGVVQEDVFEDAPIEPRDSLTPSQGVEVQEALHGIDPPSTTSKAVKEESISNREESPSAKHAEATPVLAKQSSDTGKTDRVGVAWTGQIQLSGNRQSPLIVSHRSGEKVDLKHWPKSLELKGRVRLAHLDKFLQDLQQSRSRAVTVVSILVQEGHPDQTSATEHVKEVASQYQMGDRVGFVEPRSGYELYLLPPGSGTTKLLSEHGHPDISPEALGKDVVLVGVIVWRRSHLSSSRVPDRNNNLKRHAVASSTHHESISKSSRAGVGPSKDPSSDPRSRSRGVANVSSAASSMHLLKFPVESSPTKDPSPVRNWPPSTTTTTSHANVLKAHRIIPASSDATTDMPPGFSVRQPSSQPSVASRQHLDPRQPAPSLPSADVPPGFWPRPAQNMSRQPLSEEDDDLPEFDFSVHTLPPGPPPRSPSQFNSLPGPSLNSDTLSQFPPRQSPPKVPEQGSLPPPSNPDFSSSGYPPRPPGPPPPPQDSSFLSRNPSSNYYTPVAAPMSVDNRPHEGEFRPLAQDQPPRVSLGGGSHGQAMLGQPGQPQQYGSLNASMQVGGHGAPPLASALPRNDLPEWRPSAQFQLRPPLYENDPRHLVGAPPPHPHFDPAAAVGGAPPPPLTVQQEMTWPPPQHHQQQAPPTILPPPPMPPQWQPQEQSRGHYQPQPQWQHSNHFQPQQQPQQHMTPVRPVDPRGAPPFNSWDGAPPSWDATGARNNEHHRDTRTSGEHRMKDPRSNDQVSWHDRERETNGGRPDFRRR
ncbi:hypothetical protein KC19_10G159200 [Ceratodon purpureus]|uniref:TFIIS central domain-containing protein n=1 Tax=Ceratodon purpureus TaxID=3225 RepID=A0A8T0GPG9_CERPU|nr:hypothetical protein KC19_10G159200 [Ceratodon purpureus]